MTRARFSSRSLHPLIGRSRWGKRYGCLLADVQILENYYSRNKTSSPGIIPVTVQERVDRTNLQATIRDENSEAAPRPRHCGVLHRTHTCASSLAKMSAGITNPCGYIDQPARARLGRMVTAGPAEQPLRAGTSVLEVIMMVTAAGISLSFTPVASESVRRILIDLKVFSDSEYLALAHIIHHAIYACRFGSTGSD